MFAERPAGSSWFTDITLSVTPHSPGNVQRDGTYVAAGDLGSNIYQTQGSNVVGSTVLSGTGCVRQFFIACNRRMCCDQQIVTAGTRPQSVQPYVGELGHQLSVPPRATHSNLALTG